MLFTALTKAAQQQCTTADECPACEHGLTATCSHDMCHCQHDTGTGGTGSAQCTVDADCVGQCHHDNTHHAPACHHGHCSC